MVFYIIKPLLIALLLFGLFGLVWFRSHVVTLEYNLSDLEKKKIECLKERKMLLAEKANVLSFRKVEASLSKNQGFVFPDRIRVIHVKKQKESLPHKASLDKKRLIEP
ncbi:MAG: hypothetical protein OEZ31_06195 [Nitrospirota bacterium]|nr:hypothetical protein [Nitrospirota bacterium]